MTIQRFCLTAVFVLLAAAGNTLLASMSASAFPDQLTTPAPQEDLSNAFRLSMYLFTGAVLGWSLFSLSVLRMARRELASLVEVE